MTPSRCIQLTKMEMSWPRLRGDWRRTTSVSAFTRILPGTKVAKLYTDTPWFPATSATQKTTVKQPLTARRSSVVKTERHSPLLCCLAPQLTAANLSRYSSEARKVSLVSSHHCATYLFAMQTQIT